MNTAETFEWLRERSNRLDEVEADNARLTEENVRLQLEIAQLRTKPLRDKLLEPQDMTEVMQMRFQKEQP